MSKITEDLQRKIDVFDAWLKGGDPTAMNRRVEETREVLAHVVVAIQELDARLDRFEAAHPIKD
ncbi:hypothetical protein [Leucobacter luti]|uniref:Uncharacterized protein n=1 Tax=Leucobacter luti TaxID=340320 RepID=A0A4Q7U3M4_9MICO|nr:hypothetical protein [Leucobacter luti]MBL3699273.1 hypothetical protein [Leucobacter luti]RZT66782.1 hypothetical protein EV139_0909 [Leucobacter luti]